MKYLFEACPPSEKIASRLAGLNRYEIEELEKAIYWQRLEQQTIALQESGFNATHRYRVGTEQEISYDLIQVVSPDGSQALWATIAECDRLLASNYALKNPQKAYERWVEKVEPTQTQSDRDFVDGTIERDLLRISKKAQSEGDVEKQQLFSEMATETRKNRISATNPRGAGRNSTGERRSATLTGLSKNAANKLDTVENKSQYLVGLIEADLSGN
ncbi:hypothetical protein [Chamaesiphon sp.]|uniref:hypothetical protein n=1 Tax=Chamaesiphon sp. TaxID=2814140 RepID=UPI00359344C5